MKIEPVVIKKKKNGDEDKLEIKFAKETETNLSKDHYLFIWKDLFLTSQKSYIHLSKIYDLPGLHFFHKWKNQLDNYFTIKQNEFGHYISLNEKFKFHIEKLREGGMMMNDTINLKLCIDGTLLGNKKIVNFGFSILND